MDSGVLLTDLYELTMLQAYFRQRMNGPAVFELFVRKLPPHRNFLLAAGLAQALDYLAGLRFADDDLAWLAASRRFTPEFVDSLADLRFTGDVDALPEGTVFFANEPILRISAPLREAQLVESRVMNLIHYETLVPFMRAGRLLAPHPSLGAIREHARTELLTLPEPLRSLDDAECCPVEIAPALRALAAAIDART